MFWVYYDAIKMNKAVHPAICIKDVPLYVRWRWRVVENILLEVSFERASRSKAMGVFDFSKI